MALTVFKLRLQPYKNWCILKRKIRKPTPEFLQPPVLLEKCILTSLMYFSCSKKQIWGMKLCGDILYLYRQLFLIKCC